MKHCVAESGSANLSGLATHQWRHSLTHFRISGKVTTFPVHGKSPFSIRKSFFFFLFISFCRYPTDNFYCHTEKQCVLKIELNRSNKKFFLVMNLLRQIGILMILNRGDLPDFHAWITRMFLDMVAVRYRQIFAF